MKKNTLPLLFVDDDPQFLRSLRATFRKGYELCTCTSPLEALQVLQGGKRFAVIVSDMRMPGMDGIEFLRRAAELDGEVERIMLTGHADLETAMAAVNSGGVSHFLTKPCPTQNLREAVDACAASYLESLALPLDADAYPSSDLLVGSSPAIFSLRSMLHRLGKNAATVLFTGESGTGKSLAAQVLHSIGDRRNRPFVRVNCPSLSAGVVDAELFGSVRGAYTGAVRDTVGRFRAAEGGSILLDEIADVPLELQPKLLQVIERKEFERVGDHKTNSVDVRIMAATNADLERRVAEGRFRKDLYYRLNVMHLKLPALRERRGDIPELARGFLEARAGQNGKEPFTLSENALRTMQRYDWPGNVRELEHALERGVALCADEVVRTADLPEAVRSCAATPSGGEAATDREALLAALRGAGWNKARAARSLGIGRSTLYRRMKDAGLSNEEI